MSSVKVSWYDKQNNVLIETFDSFWNVPDYIEMVDAENTLLDDHQQTVCVIVDYSDANTIPSNFVQAALYASKNISPWIDISVFVVSNPLIRKMVVFAASVVPGLKDTLFFTDSVEEATEIIYNHLGVEPPPTQDTLPKEKTE